MTASSANKLYRTVGIGLLELRGDVRDAAFLAGVSPLVLPSTVGATHDLEGHAVLCLSPDRWWISSAEGTVAKLEARLHESLQGLAHAVVLLSAGFASFRLTGPNAAEILAKGSAIDLEPAAFPGGSVRRALHAGIATVIHRPTSEYLFNLHVQRSYRHYMESWLLLAGQDLALTAGNEWSY